MTDLFLDTCISPMLIYQVEPFDDENYIYELKLDGIRCIAYLGDGKTVLQNKRFKDVTDTYPELKDAHRCVDCRTVLDGELVVLTDGKPNFYALQARSLMTDKLRINLAARKNPVQFVAYDMLYYDGKNLTNLPLSERKKYLSGVVKEGHNLSVSRYIEKDGIAFFELVKKENLEGIVAKKKDGLYHIGKRTYDWVKIKVMQEEDLVICGYKPNEKGEVKDLILGYYDKNKKLKYKGTVYAGIGKEERKVIKEFAKKNNERKALIENIKGVVWVKPELIGTVKYMHETESGSMRQPVWKGLKE